MSWNQALETYQQMSCHSRFFHIMPEILVKISCHRLLSCLDGVISFIDIMSMGGNRNAVIKNSTSTCALHCKTMLAGISGTIQTADAALKHVKIHHPHS